MRTGWIAALAAAWLALLLALPASAAEVVAIKGEDADFDELGKVAYLPFARVEPTGQKPRADCPISGKPFIPCEMEEAAEAELTRVIGKVLQECGPPFEWIHQSEINAARQRLKKKDLPGLTAHGSWQRAIAKEAGADAVLFGFVYCFRDRSGNAWASAEAAALGFCMHLVELDTGRVLLTLRYQDEQAPLFENLLTLPDFIKRGCRFITVEQMAKEAAAKISRSLPWRDKGKKRCSCP